MRASSRTDIGLLAALLVGFGAASAGADDLSYVESRQRLQQEKIYQQRSQGQVSTYEMQRFSNNSATIDRLQHSTRPSGQLDLGNRARIGSLLDHQSRATYNIPNY